MTTLERLAVALPLLLAAACTLAIARRRIVLLLGRQGPHLAPAVCIVVWLIGLTLGQAAGSLVAMSLAGSLPLLGLGLLALRTPPLRRPGPRLGPALLLALAGVALYQIVVPGFDSLCHFAIAGNYLRGNIPPTALDNPDSPLLYHPLFDAAAAVVTRALGTDLELGLDLVSLLAVLACLLAATALARALSPGSRLVPLLGVLALLLGGGPTFLRVLGSSAPVEEALHGQTSQAFLDQMLRRPFPLCFAVVALVLALLLRPPREAARRPWLTGLLLAPPFFLLPQVGEEQVLVLGLLVAGLLFLRRLPLLAAAMAGAAALAGGLASGVFRALLAPAPTSMASPRLALQWPPALPTWTEPLGGWPIPSWPAAAVALFELGPFFFLTAIALGAWVLSRRLPAGPGPPRAPAAILLAVVAANLLGATCLTLQGWPRADLDRFVFQASNLMLLATPAALLPLARWRPERPGLRRLGFVLAGLFLIGGSVGLATHRVATRIADYRPLGPERPYGQLRRLLGTAVGPRDLIATDPASAQMLVTAGFLVVAPMDSHMVGVVNGARFHSYLEANRCRARWRWLPELDPAVRASEAVVLLGGYALLPGSGCPEGRPRSAASGRDVERGQGQGRVVSQP